jgi:hypothetical protein
VAVFNGNMAILYGGGILSAYESSITIFDGSIHFENNTAMNGGGMYLGDNSKLILSLSIENNVSFVLNHAQRFGGALYVQDSQCSLFQLFMVTIFIPQYRFYSIIQLDSKAALCMEDNLTNVGYA